MIFIAGVHGIGKTSFCKKVSLKYKINFYSASHLIEKLKNEQFPMDKRISNIEENQIYLLRAVENLNRQKSTYVLDGHFCLFDENEVVTRIPFETFKKLSPQGIILLTNSPEKIVKNLFEKNGIVFDTKKMEFFQDEEIEYSQEISQSLHIPYLNFRIGNNINLAYDFINSILFN